MSQYQVELTVTVEADSPEQAEQVVTAALDSLATLDVWDVYPLTQVDQLTLPFEEN